MAFFPWLASSPRCARQRDDLSEFKLQAGQWFVRGVGKHDRLRGVRAPDDVVAAASGAPHDVVATAAHGTPHDVVAAGGSPDDVVALLGGAADDVVDEVGCPPDVSPYADDEDR